MKLKMPVRSLNDLINDKQYVSKKLNKIKLDYLGFYVLKNVFDIELINLYYRYYNKNIGVKFKETLNHKTGVDLPIVSKFNSLLKNEKLIKSIKKLFNGNIGCDYIRIIKKDSNFNESVFLHQDTPYQMGGIEKYSLFIPLTNCYLENGTLQLFPGTHKFGYLGDAGEINKLIIPNNLKICIPNLDVGDILIMNSNIFHQSGPNLVNTDRVIVELHILNSSEPTAKFLICGKNQNDFKNNLNQNQLFSNSRTQKLIRIYNDKKR